MLEDPEPKHGPEEKILSVRWGHVATAIEELSQVRTLDDVVAVLRSSTRQIVGANGIAVVLNDGNFCHYVAEDSEEPLWKGQRFPQENCVSGWAFRNRQTVLIPDIRLDPRVPQDAYAQTFVRSMVMVPIGRGTPVAALGAYWATVQQPGDIEIALLETLARGAATGLENGRLLSSLAELNADLEQRVIERTAQLERTQESLRQTQKMEIIGQLTGNVAHDFNNLLSPIMSSLDLVLGGRASRDIIQRAATIGMDAAENAKTLVQRLLAFARRQPLQPASVDLGGLLVGMKGLLLSTVGSRIDLSIEIDAHLPSIHADRHQLEMAILNLAVNARDAMPAGGKLSLHAVRTDESRPDRLGAGEFVRLSVKDEGVGMDARTLASATEPFFTTKDMGQGTGLGLSMVDGLTNQMGGALEIDSAPGKGTEIRLWLPVSPSLTRNAPADASKEDDMTQSHGDLLLVEDDPMVRLTTGEMLRDLGYQVKEAAAAQEGLDMIESGFVPDIVVTDHLMPGMTGAELALQLRREHPSIAILIVSGYQGIDLIAPDVIRLAKPFRQAQLTASLDAARAQRGGMLH